jgi:heme A synthase
MSNDRKTVEEQKINVEEAAPSPSVDRVAVEKTDAISEQKLYEENAKVTAIFWEWRHKVLTHFFGVNGALLAVTGWLYNTSGDLRWWHCVPLLVAAAYSFISYKIDKRHTKILRSCYGIAAGIELRARKDGGIFKFINDLHYTKGSLTQTLHRIYRTSAWLFVVASLLVIAISRWR